MGYPGQEAGDALVSTLIGESAPAGKTPYTWYSRGFVQQRGVIYNNDLRSGQGITYRYWTGAKPLLEYGHGLSYTNFTYGWAEYPPQTVTTAALAAGSLSLKVTITNIGALDAAAVVLVFVKSDGKGCPIKSLAGFDRVHVGSGATTTLEVEISPREVACVDEDGKAILSAGMLKLEAGDITHPATGHVMVTGAPVQLPE
jgi:hypothetical protein